MSTKASILAIGDELVRGERLDTNSHWLADQLVSLGCTILEHRTVDDDRVRIAASISTLSRDAGLLIVTGGLGPTADDLTREALGDVVSPGQELIEDERGVEHLQRWFTRRRRMPPSNHRQAMRPIDAAMVPNDHGTAMGLHASHNQCAIWLLPGPPKEMMPMFTDAVVPTIAHGDVVTRSVRVHAYGIGESAAGERLGGLLHRGADPIVGITAGSSIVSANVRTIGNADDAASRVDDVATMIESLWEPFAYGRDDDTLAAVVAQQLRNAGQTVTTAESCTGGMIASMIVDMAGSSDVFLGGFVTYSNEMKTTVLAVPEQLIIAHGAVSPEVAIAMAIGAQRAAGADWSMAVTGVAGPGASEAKPAGTVDIAIAGPDELCIHRRFRFTGDRSTVRLRSALSALQMVRLAMNGTLDSTRLLWQDETS